MIFNTFMFKFVLYVLGFVVGRVIGLLIIGALFIYGLYQWNKLFKRIKERV